jgi:hypothetical protein
MQFITRVLLAAAFVVPAIAHADILLRNKDGKGYTIAIRHSVATTTTSLPAKCILIVTEGAQTIQLRDAQGEPKGAAIEVADGDRFEVRGGKLTKTGSRETVER